MFIVLATSDSPENQIHKRFYKVNHKWPLKFTGSVVEHLNQLGLAHRTEVLHGELDLTEFFKDGFQKPHQKSFLEFLTLNKMSLYPEAVSKVCIDYLKSECLGEKPGRYLVPFTYDIIIC